MQAILEPLERLDSPAAQQAARQLRVLSAPTPAAAAAAAAAGMQAVDDLLYAPGGRHDNDHADFRDIDITVKSDEASVSLLLSGQLV
jgi:hypothetical protein